ncbi:MAG: discoidin domain-containing protein [Verrucomicrobiota bacterium]|jgi:hypothetical protein
MTKWVLAVWLGVSLSTNARAAQEAISLAGAWRFQLDRENSGVLERWFERELKLRIQLPGALQNQGFGDEISVETDWTGAANVETWLRGKQYEKYRQPGNIKVPFCLQPERHYVGVAWYQREFELPAAWRGKRVVLTLERAHWETRLWLDGKAAGTNSSLSTPHRYDLGVNLAPGKHRLTIRVDNHLLVDVGSWAHSVSDHTQGNWNGVVGRIELSATSPVWIEDAQVYPNVAKRSVLVRTRLGNATGLPGHGTLTFRFQISDFRFQSNATGVPGHGTLTLGGRQVPVSWEETGGSVETEVRLGDRAQPWDEFHPALQKLALELKGEQADDQRTVRFGLREIRAEGRQFVLNGQPAFFRGTLECCIFPLTGYPPTDVESWKRVLGVCKAHGLNLIRFHSWCPPEAAFVAADELGFYFQVECAVWTNPGEAKALGEWIYAESERIVRAYGNHPSFVLLTHGNEPHGRNCESFLAGWVNYWKQRDPRRLVTSGSAYPQLPENQFHVYYPCRGPHGWLGRDYRRDVEGLAVPVIVHEMGQWCVYPNFDEIRKYTGPLKAKNFEVFRDCLAEHGMLDQWRDFLRASGKLQALCYKEEIEAALRTPGIGGFELLDLHDFPGQGTALVGVLDAFWDGKGYITAAEYRRFCNATVPLARVLKRVWTTGETLSAEVELAHFGPGPLGKAVARWRLVSEDGTVVAKGELRSEETGREESAERLDELNKLNRGRNARGGSRGGASQRAEVRTIPVGQGIQLGRIAVSLAEFAAPKAYKLVVGLKGTPFENDWNIWVYPAKGPVSEPAAALVTPALDQPALAQLAAGGKVLLLSPKLSGAHPRLGFEPIFWNRYMFNTQERQTLGLLCHPRHPALAQFPTAFYQDWQWNEIVSGGRAMVLDDLPRELRPMVQVIDDWNTNRKLGLVWECRVGPGRLLVCSADLARELAQRPAARQLRTSLLAYVAGKEFNPKIEVSQDALARLLEFSPPSRLVKLGAKVLEADSEDRANGNLAANAIDGDAATIWHTQWTPENDPMPHHLIIDLGREVVLHGVTYLPRQDMANGRIAQCEVFCSNAPKAWSAPAAKAQWPNSDQLQALKFAPPVKARYLKVVAKSEVNGNPFASIAELDILTDEK